MLLGESSASDKTISDTPDPAPVGAIRLRVILAKTVRMTVRMDTTIKFAVKTDPEMR